MKMSRLLITACAALVLIIAPEVVQAQQFVRVESAEVSRRNARTMQNSKAAQRFFNVRGTTITAARGYNLVKSSRGRPLIIALPAAAPRPPRDARYQAYFEAIIDDSDAAQTIAFVCACGEQNADPNNDDCGFEIDDNQYSTCKWEGDGESRCTCVKRVLIWGNGEEHVLTYAGDPVAGDFFDD